MKIKTKRETKKNFSFLSANFQSSEKACDMPIFFISLVYTIKKEIPTKFVGISYFN